MRVARAAAVVTLALVIAGCGPSGQTASPPAPADSAPAPSAGPDLSASPAASDTTQAAIEQLLAQAVSQPIDLSDPGPELGLAEQGTKDAMRRASAVAEILGPDGAAILAGIDTAEREAIAALAIEMGAQARTRGAAVAVDLGLPGTVPGAARLASVVIPAPPGGSGVQPSDPLEGLTGVYMLTMEAPNAFAGLERGANGDLDAPAVTEDRTGARGERVHTSRHVTLIGSKLTFELEMSIEVAGPPAYTEVTSGMVTVDLCPDANGLVPLELSLGSRSSLLGGGMQYDVVVTATGHVDDNARLAAIDLTLDGSMATQPLTGNGALGSRPMFLETAFEQTVDMIGDSPTRTTHTGDRFSSHVDGSFAGIAASLLMFGRQAAFGAANRAQQEWTAGYCLAITVPELTGPAKPVDPGSETPFTAVVSHKFETTQLHVPVTATLASGTVSVTPSGTKVPSPASFRYRAPGELDKTAAVLLETRSKRGIATLNVEFRTGLSAYRASWQDRNVTWSGVVCGLDRPFTITVVSFSTDGSGADLTMLFEFAPAGPAGGTVSFDVTKYGTHWKGAGPYEVKAAATGQLSLVGQIRGSYTTSGQTGYYPIAFNVPLTPLTTNECATP